MSEIPEFSADRVWSNEVSIEHNRIDPRFIFDTDQKFQALANKDNSDMSRQLQLAAILASYNRPTFIDRSQPTLSSEASAMQGHRSTNLEVAGNIAKVTVKAIGRQLGRATLHLLMKREDTL
jgi:hypothetical protein